MPLDRRARPFCGKCLHQIGFDDIPAEGLLLEKLQSLHGRARVGEILEVRWPRPVLEVLEVGDERWIREVLLRSEVVKIMRVSKRLNELQEVTVSDDRAERETGSLPA